MRPSTFVREVAQSFGSRPVMAALILLVALMSTAAPALLELSSLRMLEESKTNDEVRGANVLVVTDNESPVSARECASINGWGGVRSAGWYSDRGVAEFAESPRNPFHIVATSPIFLTQIDPSLNMNAGGIVLGTAAADELGVRSGDLLHLRGDLVSVAAVVDTTIRAPEQSRWIFDVRDAGQFTADECWVEADAGGVESLAQVVRAAFQYSSTLRIEARVLAEFERSYGVWLDRPTKFAWIFIGFVSAVPAMIVLTARRREMAVYVMAGTSRPLAVMIQVIALWIPMVIGTIGTTVITSALSHSVLQQWTSTGIFLTASSAFGAAAVSMAIVALVAALIGATPKTSGLRDRD